MEVNTRANLKISDLDLKKISGAETTKNNIPGGGGTYTDTPLKYDGGDFQFELPEMYAPYGVSEFKNEKKTDYSVGFQLSKSPSDNYIKECIEAIYKTIAITCLYPVKELVGIPRLNVTDIDTIADKFVNPVTIPVDKNGKPKSGADPMFYCKFFNYDAKDATDDKKAKKEWKTIFTTPSGAIVPWSMLMKSSFKCIPYIRVEGVYCGQSLARLKVKVVSAVITDIKPRLNQDAQQGTRNELQAKNPELVSSVEKQMEDMRAEMEKLKAQLAAATAPKPSSPVGTLPAFPTASVAPPAGVTSSLESFLASQPSA